MIWDVALADDPGRADWNLPSYLTHSAMLMVMGSSPLFVLVPLHRISSTPCERRAISLRDGKTLWSHTTTYREDVLARFAAGDLDGDGRPELVVRDQLLANAQAQFEVTALDGRDGSTRWTWLGGGLFRRNQPESARRVPGRFRGQGNKRGVHPISDFRHTATGGDSRRNG